MTYLTNLQRAIEATKCVPLSEVLSIDYLRGWNDAGFDLIAAQELGETACRTHLKNWLDTTPFEWDANNQGYHDRLKAIQEYMEMQNETA